MNISSSAWPAISGLSISETRWIHLTSKLSHPRAYKDPYNMLNNPKNGDNWFSPAKNDRNKVLQAWRIPEVMIYAHSQRKEISLSPSNHL